MIVLIMLIGAGIVYWIMQYLYRKHWNSNLTAEVYFATDHAVKGDQVELVEVVTNAKRLPIPFVNLKFQMDRSLDLGNADTSTVVSDQTYRNDIFSLFMNQKVTRKISVICRRRGVYRINKIDMVSQGAFMTDILIASTQADAQIVVYPVLADPSQLKIPFQMVMGTIEKNSHLYEDKFVFRGIRDYQVYDSMNSINWKASARVGHLCVNQYNETMCQQVCILLNLEPEGMNQEERRVEECISIAAGLSQMFIEQGVSTELVCNGRDALSSECIRVYSGAGFSHLSALNTGLARIDADKEMPEFTEMIDQLEKKTNTSVLYVMISMNERKNLQEAFDRLTNYSRESVWITPAYADSQESPVYCNASFIHWQVSRYDS